MVQFCRPIRMKRERNKTTKTMPPKARARPTPSSSTPRTASSPRTPASPPRRNVPGSPKPSRPVGGSMARDLKRSSSLNVKPVAVPETTSKKSDVNAEKLRLLEEEKEFYKNKLRDLEILVDDACRTSGGGEHTALAAHQIRAILYASNEVFKNDYKV